MSANYWTEEVPNPEAHQTAQPAQQPAPQEPSGLDAWLADLQAERMENWRNEAIQQYPQVASLREYLTANTKAETMALAKDLAEKLGGSEAPTPGARVPGGSPAIARHPGDQHYGIEQAQEDIRNGRDRAAVFQDHLAQKFHDQGRLAPWEE